MKKVVLIIALTIVVLGFLSVLLVYYKARADINKFIKAQSFYPPYSREARPFITSVNFDIVRFNLDSELWSEKILFIGEVDIYWDCYYKLADGTWYNPDGAILHWNMDWKFNTTSNIQ